MLGDNRTSQHQHSDRACCRRVLWQVNVKEGYPMSKNVVGIALALTIIGGLAIASGVTAEGSKLQSAGANTHAFRTDGCPYYPSPVVCRVSSTARTTSGT